MSGTLRIVLILPFAPDERETHDRLIAASCALHAENGSAQLDIVQLAAAAGAVPARAVGDAARWCEFSGPCAADNRPAVLAMAAAEALAAIGAHDADRRLILLPPGTGGEELAALLAARLGGCSLGHCSAIGIDGSTAIGRRAAFGGRLVLELRGTARDSCATWRPEQPDLPALHPVTESAIRRHVSRTPAPEPREAFVVESADAKPRLEGAAAIVSGGRGMDAEGFELLGRIADSLGAALGGSLPAVDAGWVPVSRQIGQSGKFVSPRLYFAVGISGTPQHLAGIAGSTRIVVLNKDEDAPIFRFAEAGVAGDWRMILPLLAQHLEQRRPAS